MQRIPAVLWITGVAFLLSAGSPPPTSSGIQFFADAYGSQAGVASTVFAGRSALVTFGTCGTLRAPRQKTNTVSSVNARPMAATGVVNTGVAAADTSSVDTASARATVSATNLLGGLVMAREVRAMSETSRDGGGFHTSASGSALSQLSIAGVPMLVAPRPNTHLGLAGIGDLVLNEQIVEIGPTSASLTVNMIHVVATVPNSLLPLGAHLVVGHARSSLVLTDIAGTLDGFAYGSSAHLGRTFVSGRSAPVSLGCSGTNGALERETVATVFVPAQLATGVVVDTARGVTGTSSASGDTSSTVEAANVLSGLVTADVVRAQAHSFTDGRVFTFSTDGTEFTGLAVRGFPDIDAHVAANTRISLAGIGTLWLRRVISTPNSIEVRMIEVEVTQANALGIPIGSDIQVGVAHASAH